MENISNMLTVIGANYSGLPSPYEIRYFQYPTVVNIDHMKMLLHTNYDLRRDLVMDVIHRRGNLVDQYTMIYLDYIFNWMTVNMDSPMRFFCHFVKQVEAGEEAGNLEEDPPMQYRCNDDGERVLQQTVALRLKRQIVSRVLSILREVLSTGYPNNPPIAHVKPDSKGPRWKKSSTKHTLGKPLLNSTPATATSTSDLGSIAPTSSLASLPSTSDLTSIPSTSRLANLPSTSELGSTPAHSEVGNMLSVCGLGNGIPADDEAEKKTSSQSPQPFTDFKVPLLPKPPVVRYFHCPITVVNPVAVHVKRPRTKRGIAGPRMASLSRQQCKIAPRSTATKSTTAAEIITKRTAKIQTVAMKTETKSTNAPETDTKGTNTEADWWRTGTDRIATADAATTTITTTDAATTTMTETEEIAEQQKTPSGNKCSETQTDGGEIQSAVPDSMQKPKPVPVTVSIAETATTNMDVSSRYVAKGEKLHANVVLPTARDIIGIGVPNKSGICDTSLRRMEPAVNNGDQKMGAKENVKHRPVMWTHTRVDNKPLLFTADLQEPVAAPRATPPVKRVPLKAPVSTSAASLSHAATARDKQKPPKSTEVGKTSSFVRESDSNGESDKETTRMKSHLNKSQQMLKKNEMFSGSSALMSLKRRNLSSTVKDALERKQLRPNENNNQRPSAVRSEEYIQTAAPEPLPRNVRAPYNRARETSVSVHCSEHSYALQASMAGRSTASSTATAGKKRIQWADELWKEEIARSEVSGEPCAKLPRRETACDLPPSSTLLSTPKSSLADVQWTQSQKLLLKNVVASQGLSITPIPMDVAAGSSSGSSYLGKRKEPGLQVLTSSGLTTLDRNTLAEGSKGPRQAPVKVARRTSLPLPPLIDIKAPAAQMAVAAAAARRTLPGPSRPPSCSGTHDMSTLPGCSTKKCLSVTKSLASRQMDTPSVPPQQTSSPTLRAPLAASRPQRPTCSSTVTSTPLGAEAPADLTFDNQIEQQRLWGSMIMKGQSNKPSGPWLEKHVDTDGDSSQLGNGTNTRRKQ